MLSNSPVVITGLKTVPAISLRLERREVETDQNVYAVTSGTVVTYIDHTLDRERYGKMDMWYNNVYHPRICGALDEFPGDLVEFKSIVDIKRLPKDQWKRKMLDERDSR